jgi:hypothetical protein
MNKAVFADISPSMVDAPVSKVELHSLLRVTCPQPSVSPSGFQYFAPEDVKYFDTLFERFGLRFSSSDDRFDDIKYVAEIWYRLVGHFGAFVECADLWPKIFARRIAEWPPGFADYLRAVMDGDRVKAQALAAALNIEMLGAEMPRQLMG